VLEVGGGRKEEEKEKEGGIVKADVDTGRDACERMKQRRARK
jgi:hypothetical protein